LGEKEGSWERMNPEMEFLDISLARDSSPLLQGIFTFHSTGGFYRKPYSSLVLKILITNQRNKKTQVYTKWRLAERKNEGRKPDKKL
jgi:hypothetical protein